MACSLAASAAPSAPCSLPSYHNAGSCWEMARPLDFFANGAKPLYCFTEMKVAGHNLPLARHGMLQQHNMTSSAHFKHGGSISLPHHSTRAPAMRGEAKGASLQQWLWQIWLLGLQCCSSHWNRVGMEEHECLLPPSPRYTQCTSVYMHIIYVYLYRFIFFFYFLNLELYHSYQSYFRVI